MKARTKGQRRGRPKKKGVPRTPSGRISRAKEQPARVALEARARMHSISIDKAQDQRAATFLGRLHMTYVAWERRDKGKDKPQPAHSISTRQYFALLQYQDLHNDYLKAIGAPGAYYEPYLGNSGDEDANARWAHAVKKSYEAAREAIQSAQNYQRQHNLWAALDYCLLRDQEHTEMIGALRELGNTLSRHFARA